jgi:hypothetical protein
MVELLTYTHRVADFLPRWCDFVLGVREELLDRGIDAVHELTDLLP